MYQKTKENDTSSEQDYKLWFFHQRFVFFQHGFSTSVSKVNLG